MLDGKITLDDRAVREALARVRAGVKNPRPLMIELAGRLHDAVEENFATQGRPKWPGLKPATIRQRKKQGYWPGKILQRRGQLARSIEPGASREKAWVGTNLRYAAIHQVGDALEDRGLFNQRDNPHFHFRAASRADERVDFPHLPDELVPNS